MSDFQDKIAKHGLEYFGKFYSDYRGTVVSNEDPEFRGRLQINVPQVYGENVPDYWSPSKGMFAGALSGFYALPKPGDTVWVSFEMGDPKYPVWTYGSFLPNTSPAAEEETSPNRYIYQTTNGQKFILDDDELKGIIDAGKIYLGAELEAVHPVAYGDITVQLLTSLCEVLVNLCTTLSETQVTTLAGPMPFLNLAAYPAIGILIKQIEDILSELESQLVFTK